jgi:hypothetical protein
MMSSGVLQYALLVILIAGSTLAQSSWVITESYGAPSDCPKPENVRSYVAYPVNQCFPLDAYLIGTPPYRKYSCASDGYTPLSCWDSMCSNCTANSTKIGFVSCTIQSGAGSDFQTTRCGALPAGAEGLSTIAYVDNST